MEPTTGIEPVNLFLTKEVLYLLSYVGRLRPFFALSGPRSILPRRVDPLWSGKRDSNPRRSAWKADALPTELFPRQARFLDGPLCLWWRGEDSNLRRLRQQIYSLPPLATREPLQRGAGDGTRTRNLLITNQLLYRLSYASKWLLYKSTFFILLTQPCQALRL